ncbi:unnamed protein product [Clonostachys rhizophaga]|uniref:C2H2-type domain-containing protein n=1 Tax=Clonostachys rhizophaga TaxID=160324 RepID=A0A9N9YNL7_9HYPO|nr:unnamed protein product [Clonostachys rhizophaga]
MDQSEPQHHFFASFSDGTIDPRVLTLQTVSEDLNFEEEQDTSACSSSGLEDIAFDECDPGSISEWDLEYPSSLAESPNLQNHEILDPSSIFMHQETGMFLSDYSNFFTCNDVLPLSHAGYPSSMASMPVPVFYDQASQATQMTTPPGRPLLPKPIGVPSPETPSQWGEKEGAKEPKRRKRKDPKDLKKNQRKESKPERCPMRMCSERFPYKRELDRHMVSNHRSEAARRGLDVSKCKCPYCGKEFDNIRYDRLVKHMKLKHPNHSQPVNMPPGFRILEFTVSLDFKSPVSMIWE